MAKSTVPTVSSSRSKPHHAKPYSAPASSGPISISKTKSNLRQAMRLLAKDKLDAQLRVETERRVESWQRELEEALKQRPADQANVADVANSSKNDVKGKGKQKDEDEGDVANGKSGKKDQKGDKYKMLKHFEYQKTSRRCKRCRKELATAEEDLRVAEEQAESDKKKLKKVRKAVDKLHEELLMARIDAWYVETFPKSLKYVSLYPPDGLVEFTLDSLQSTEPSEAGDFTKMPPKKKPDEVRQYWRSIVKGKLDREELTGEPMKEKKEKKKPTDTADVPGSGTSEASEREGEEESGQEDSNAESTDAEMVDGDEEEEEKDDFFA